MAPASDIPWERLREAAVDVAGRAHAPYSNLRVGAAGLTSDGRVIVGCNVENASFGLTLCAECGLVSALHADGVDDLVAVCVRTDQGVPLTPCGRCRQLLSEAGEADMLVDAGPEIVTIADLIPGAFGPARLDELT
ncbi:MAG: cytidine deaminase [Acidimicrobiales bacterium]